jgi:RimJ/RimL family protein N-acetyltransferase
LREPICERPLSGLPVASPPSGLRPRGAVLEGRYARIEPLDPDLHGAELFAASHDDPRGRDLWTYMSYGPFESPASFTLWLRDCAAAADPFFFAIRDGRTGRAAGMASYLNIHPKNGTIEIGHIWLAPSLQRTREATEALYLLLDHALGELRYRRLEWKCDALNEASRRAARRLGFRFEGIFYQHMVVKGRNRDTAWYSILDHEWPALRQAFESWLAPGNFDPAGRARQSLSALTAARG